MTGWGLVSPWGQRPAALWASQVETLFVGLSLR